MAAKIQLRRDTASVWASVNPTLALGEPGVETDTYKVKVGDGTSDWNALPYSVTTQFTELNGLPTTIAGYAISDAYTKAEVDAIIESPSGNLTGSVFADDSSIMIDGVAGKIVGQLEVSNPFINGAIDTTDSSPITITPDVVMSAGLTIGNHIIPSSNENIDLGSNTNRFRELFLSGNTISLDNLKLSCVVATGTLQIHDGSGTLKNIQSHNINANDITANNITTTGYIAGPAVFTIDPAAVGDNTGKVVIAGDLQVDGTQTTINSTTVAIDDLNFSIASDAADSSEANGAGITVGGANANITYTHATTSWDFNKPVNVTGNIGVTGTVDGVDIATRDGVLGTTTTTANAALPKAGGTMSGNIAMGTNDITGVGSITATTYSGITLGGSLAGDYTDAKVQYGTSYSGTPGQGSFFFDSLNAKLKVYNGSSFVDAVPAGGGGGGGGGSSDATATFRKYNYDITSTTNSVSGKDSVVVTAGAFVIGYQYEILSVGNTDFQAIGASADTVGVTFTATGVGSGTGTAGHILNYVTSGTQNVEVYRNGAKMVEGASDDYVATTGTSVNFTFNLADGDVVDVQVYELLTQDSFYLKSETYNQTQTIAGFVAKSGDTMTGNLAVEKSANPIISVTETGAGAVTIQGTGSGGRVYSNSGNKLLIGGGGQNSHLIIDTLGKVGIGTDTPDFMLDVEADKDTWISRIYNTGSDANAQALLVRADATAAHNSTVMGVYADGGYKLVIRSTGKVGIGTSSPTGNLTIANPTAYAPNTISAANSYIQLGSTDYGSGGSSSDDGKFMIGFGYTDGLANTNSPAYIGFEETSTSGDTKGDLTFYTRNVVTDTQPTKRMTISDDGYVGIGTDAPDASVTTYHSNNAITGLFKLWTNTADNTGTEGASIDWVASGDSTAVGAKIGATRVGAGAKMDLRFYTGRNTDANHEKMRIGDTGNLELAYNGAIRQQADGQALSIITPASGGGQGIGLKRLDSNIDQNLGEISWSNNTQDGQASIRVKTEGAVNTTDMIFGVNQAGTAIESLLIRGNKSGLIRAAKPISSFTDSGTKQYGHICTGSFYQSTGYIVIHTNIPGHTETGNANMLSFKIRGFEYAVFGAIDMNVGVYCGENNFYSASFSGTYVPEGWRDNVQMATDSNGKLALILGSTTSVQRIEMAVTDFIHGFYSVDEEYATGWTMTHETALTGYTGITSLEARMSSPRPAFHAYLTANTAFAAGTLARILGSVEHNDGGHYDTSTGRFTVPTKGIYHFDMALQLSSSATTQTYVSAEIRVNQGVRYIGGWFEKTGGNYGAATGSVTLKLDRDDYVEFYCELASTTNALGGAAGYTYLSGTQIG